MISVGDKHFQISEAIELSLWSINLSFVIESNHCKSI